MGRDPVRQPACTSAPNDCSLRAAVSRANAAPDPDTVTLPAGTFTLTRPNAAANVNEDENLTGDIDIRGDVTITGAGRATTIVDANRIDRGFDALQGAITISRLTVRNGAVPTQQAIGFQNGGGIVTSAQLTLNDVALTGNSAAAGGGFSAGTSQGTRATLTNVAITEITGRSPP